MKTINLLPWREQLLQQQQLWLQFLGISILVAILLIITAKLFLTYASRSVEYHKRQLLTQLAAIKPKTESVQRLRQVVMTLEQYCRDRQKVVLENQRVLAILTTLNQQLPVNVVIQRIERRSRCLTVYGETLSFSQLTKWLYHWRSSLRPAQLQLKIVKKDNTTSQQSYRQAFMLQIVF